MAMRLVEIMIGVSHRDAVHEVLEAHDVYDAWDEPLTDDRVLVRTMIAVEKSEPILDNLEQRLADSKSHRVLLFPLEATLPRLSDEERAPRREREGGRRFKLPQRISRDELYDDLFDQSRIGLVYLVLVGLGSVLAAYGLLLDNTVLIVGAAVVAPLVGPNVALAFAATLGDLHLARRAAAAAIAGLGVTILISVVIGAVATLEWEAVERGVPAESDLRYVAIALISGAAGALAFTTAAPASLVGVTVSVALLPPAVAAGMLFGAGHIAPAADALMLLALNVICVNLAGIVTFRLQRIRPATWWDEERARRARWIAYALWSGLLAILMLLLMFSID